MRINEGIDPNMIGMEYADAKKGASLRRPAKVTVLKRELKSDPAPGQYPIRIARHMPRAYRRVA